MDTWERSHSITKEFKYAMRKNIGSVWEDMKWAHGGALIDGDNVFSWPFPEIELALRWLADEIHRDGCAVNRAKGR
jgi:hypothetical protein